MDIVSLLLVFLLAVLLVAVWRTRARTVRVPLGVLGLPLCWAGIHDFEVIEVTGAFGPAGMVEKVRCRRCGLVTARTAKPAGDEDGDDDKDI